MIFSTGRQVSQYWMSEGNHSSSIITSVPWFHYTGHNVNRQKTKQNQNNKSLLCVYVSVWVCVCVWVAYYTPKIDISHKL